MELPTPRTATRRDSHDGLSYELWLPESEPPWPGVVVLHGAGSRKENHADFARAASGSGMTAIVYDQRGHGETGGRMSPEAIHDVGRMARILGSETGVDPTRMAVRGSSMGGYMAIQAAATSDSITGVIAFCPAGEQHLLWGLRHDELEMEVDRDAFEPWLEEHDLREAVELMGSKPLIMIHAQGDEQIPYTWSQELHERAAEPKRLVIVPGGHHRSAQHDPELQSVALRWLLRAWDQ
jgi:fermentation-respiration switch protein FrsA (DUF1100 family)